MNLNITLITSILLTAAATGAGTYYLTSNGQLGTTPSIESSNQISDQNPASVAINQQPNKPIEIIVKTEVSEKHRQTKQHDFVAETEAAFRTPQPHYVIGDGPGK